MGSSCGTTSNHRAIHANGAPPPPPANSKWTRAPSEEEIEWTTFRWNNRWPADEKAEYFENQLQNKLIRKTVLVEAQTVRGSRLVPQYEYFQPTKVSVGDSFGYTMHRCDYKRKHVAPKNIETNDPENDCYPLFEVSVFSITQLKETG